MNKFIYIFILLLLNGCYDRPQVTIGKYRWKQYSQNDTLFIDKNNNVLIPPSKIEIWGHYPYLWGQSYKNGEGCFFIINTRTNDLIYVDSFHEFQKKTGIEVNLEKLVTFYDLYGQWKNQVKLKYLQDEFNRDGN